MKSAHQANTFRVLGHSHFLSNTADLLAIRKEDAIYIDKTLFLRDIMRDQKHDVIAISRPSGFGKSLMASTINYFFDQKIDRELTEKLFKDTLITEDLSFCQQHQQKYLVIHLSFKLFTATSKAEFNTTLKQWIKALITQYLPLIDTHLVSNTLRAITSSEPNKNNENPAELFEYLDALRETIELLNRSNKKTMVIIDDYDKPFIEGYIYDYFQHAGRYIKKFIAALRYGIDNKILLFSIFSFLQDSAFQLKDGVQINEMISKQYSVYFGFTAIEIATISEKLTQPTSPDAINLAAEQCGTYLVGNHEDQHIDVYNPTDIFQKLYPETNQAHPLAQGTKTADFIRQILNRNQHFKYPTFNKIMKYLHYDPGTVPHNDFIYYELSRFKLNISDITKWFNIFWTVLFQAGYFTQQYQSGITVPILQIPSKQIAYQFNHILDNGLSQFYPYFNHLLLKEFTPDATGLEKFYQALNTAHINFNDVKGTPAINNLLLGLAIAQFPAENIVIYKTINQQSSPDFLLILPEFNIALAFKFLYIRAEKFNPEKPNAIYNPDEECRWMRTVKQVVEPNSLVNYKNLTRLIQFDIATIERQQNLLLLFEHFSIHREEDTPVITPHAILENNFYFNHDDITQKGSILNDCKQDNQILKRKYLSIKNKIEEDESEEQENEEEETTQILRSHSNFYTQREQPKSIGRVCLEEQEVPEGGFNLIFLDIDGVIYVGAHYDPEHEDRISNNIVQQIEYHPTIIKHFLDPNILASLDLHDLSATLAFSKKAIHRVIKLCQSFDAKIVLSTAWRERKTMTQLKALFSMHGFSEYIIGATPVNYDCRGIQIKTWVDAHPHLVKSFVVFDDNKYGTLLKLGDRFIYCKNMLKHHEYYLAKKILAGKNRAPSKKEKPIITVNQDSLLANSSRLLPSVNGNNTIPKKIISGSFKALFFILLEHDYQYSVIPATDSLKFQLIHEEPESRYLEILEIDAFNRLSADVSRFSGCQVVRHHSNETGYYWEIHGPSAVLEKLNQQLSALRNNWENKKAKTAERNSAQPCCVS